MKKIIIGTILSVGMIGMVLFGQSTQTTAQQLVVSSPPPTGVSSSAISNVGVKASTTWCYWVVAVYPIGMSVANRPACTSLSNGTLTSGNYNKITWTPPPGATATGFWVIATHGNTFPATGTDAVNTTVLAANIRTLNHQSNTLHAFTYVPIPTAIGLFSINNTGNSTPVMSLKINGVTASQWSSGGGGGLAFSSIGTGTNSTATMTVGTGAIITSSGSGSIVATDTAKVNGAVVPTSAAFLASNSSKQIIAASLNNITFTYTGNVSVAGVNSGTIIIPAVTGTTLRLTDFQFQAIGGNFGTCTSVNLDDTAGTPIVGVAVPIADLTANTIVGPGATSVVFTTYAWQGQLTVSKGLQVKSVGTCDTATSINYRVSVTLN